MALVLKSGRQYTDISNGAILTAPWAEVTRSEGDRRIRQQTIEVQVFYNQVAYSQGAKSLEQRVYGVEGDEFDKFFSLAALKEHGKDIYSISEDYLLQLPAMVAEPLKDGEQPPLEWGDLWQRQQ